MDRLGRSAAQLEGCAFQSFLAVNSLSVCYDPQIGVEGVTNRVPQKTYASCSGSDDPNLEQFINPLLSNLIHALLDLSLCCQHLEIGCC